MVECCEDRVEDDNNYYCYVVWYDINKTRSWVDALALSVECSVLYPSIERVLHDILFRYLTHHCMTRTDVENKNNSKMLYMIQGRLFIIAMRVFPIKCF
jgi:hypothetical protein